MKKLNVIKTAGIVLAACLFATSGVVNAAEVTNYEVKAGDNLQSIAIKNGLSISQLMELNGSIVNPDLIYTGDSIKISGNKSAKKVNKSNKMGAKANASTTGYAHPLNMPGAPVSSEFGYRQDPTGMSGTQHDGIDLAVASGTPVYAVKSGTVVEAGFHYSAGNYVIIKHQNGQYTYYFHLSSINTYTGQQVGQLTHIGNVGTTGYSTGSHLHFGISSALWSGFENPRNYVAF